MSDFIDVLELSVRTGNVLRKAGIATEAQFLALKKPDVMAMPHAGVRTWREIEQMQENLRPSESTLRAEVLEKISEVVFWLNRVCRKRPEIEFRVVYERDESGRMTQRIYWRDNIDAGGN